MLLCCGEMTSRVWGYAYRGDDALAAYFVEWTRGHSYREATFDLIIGQWGEGNEATGAKGRFFRLPSLRHRPGIHDPRCQRSPRSNEWQ